MPARPPSLPTPHRGTEVYKSPEMLMLNNMRTSNSGGGAFSLGGRGGVGAASDVWSLGCVAYELLSGSILFAGDYATVTHRVAFGAGPALILVPSERAKLEDVAELVSLVEFILVRDPAHRPGLEAVAARIAVVKAKLEVVATQQAATALEAELEALAARELQREEEKAAAAAQGGDAAGGRQEALVSPHPQDCQAVEASQ